MNFIELTCKTGQPTLINLDNVTDIYPDNERSIIFFNVSVDDNLAQTIVLHSITELRRMIEDYCDE